MSGRPPAIDLKKLLPGYSARTGRFEVLTLPPARFLMIDGHGDPNSSPAYAAALATLFPVAYRLKFLSRDELGRDYVVMPLEALWWAEDMDAFTSARDKSRWSWTVMIATPDWLAASHVADARDAVERKGGAPALSELRFDTLTEGLVVQTLHLGSYDDEGPPLAALHHDFLPSESLVPSGRHHEVYLNDARRTPPEKLRTILRQPVARG